MPTGQTFTTPQRAVSGSVYDNCTFRGIPKDPLSADGANNITVKNCRFENCGNGFYAHQSSNLNVLDCTFRNCGNMGQGGRGNFVQFDKCTGGKVLRNRGLNEQGKSDPEDIISLYATKNVEVAYNVFKGGGPSGSGGGLMCGENDGAITGDDNDIHDNVLVDVGQYGCAIWGGKGNKLRNNRIYARSQPWVNVGIHTGGGNLGSGNVMDGNKVDVTSPQWGKNPYYGYNKPTPAGTNDFNANLSSLAGIDPFTFVIDGQPPVVPPVVPPVAPTVEALAKAVDALNVRVTALEAR